MPLMQKLATSQKRKNDCRQGSQGNTLQHTVFAWRKFEAAGWSCYSSHAATTVAFPCICTGSGRSHLLAHALLLKP
jgi:O-acetyl-ADP-ribose deacetylase (regulator of RNase III)